MVYYFAYLCVKLFCELCEKCLWLYSRLYMRHAAYKVGFKFGHGNNHSLYVLAVGLCAIERYSHALCVKRVAMVFIFLFNVLLFAIMLSSCLF